MACAKLAIEILFLVWNAISVISVARTPVGLTTGLMSGRPRLPPPPTRSQANLPLKKRSASKEPELAAEEAAAAAREKRQKQRETADAAKQLALRAEHTAVVAAMTRPRPVGLNSGRSGHQLLCEYFGSSCLLGCDPIGK